jgi:hypothetical protein
MERQQITNFIPYDKLLSPRWGSHSYNGFRGFTALTPGYALISPSGFQTRWQTNWFALIADGEEEHRHRQTTA